MRSRREERRLMHVPAERLGPYVQGLRELEAAIEYPAGERVFTIDHGSDYQAFFSGMGEAHFALALEGSVVVGNVVGVLKRVRLGKRSLEALYVCDLKVGQDQRGRGVARGLLAFGL